MTSKDLINAIGEVDEKYILESEPRVVIPLWKKVVPMAAAVVLVTVGVLYATLGNGSSKKENMNLSAKSGDTVEMAEMATEPDLYFDGEMLMGANDIAAAPEETAGLTTAAALSSDDGQVVSDGATGEAMLGVEAVGSISPEITCTIELNDSNETVIEVVIKGMTQNETAEILFTKAAAGEYPHVELCSGCHVTSIGDGKLLVEKDDAESDEAISMSFIGSSEYASGTEAVGEVSILEDGTEVMSFTLR